MNELEIIQTSNDGLALPYSNTWEQQAIGTALNDNETLYAEMKILKPDDFFIKAHREVFDSALQLSNSGRDASPNMVNSFMMGGKNKKEYIEIGGLRYLEELYRAPLPREQIGQVVENLYALSIRRQLIELGTALTQLPRIDSDKTEDENIVNFTYQAIIKIKSRISQRITPFHFMRNIHAGLIEDLDQKIKANNKSSPAIYSGSLSLDNYLNYEQYDKIALYKNNHDRELLNFALNICSLCLPSIIDLSNDDGTAYHKSKYWQEFISIGTGIPAEKINNADVNQEEFDEIYHWIRKTEDLPLRYYKSQDSIKNIITNIKDLKYKFGLDCIIFDNLSAYIEKNASQLNIDPNEFLKEFIENLLNLSIEDKVKIIVFTKNMDIFNLIKSNENIVFIDSENDSSYNKKRHTKNYDLFDSSTDKKSRETAAENLKFEPLAENAKREFDKVAMAKAIGNQLTSARNAIGMTQQELCAELKISSKVLVKIENGDPAVTFDRVLLVAARLGVEIIPA